MYPCRRFNILLLLVTLYCHLAAYSCSNSMTHWWAIQLHEEIIVDKNLLALDGIASDIARQHLLQFYGRIGELTGHYMFYSFNTELDKKSIEYHFDQNPAIKWFQYQELKFRHKRQISNFAGFPDPLFPDQWHLNNRRKPKHDLNVIPVWDYNVTGKDVVVAIIDDGIQINNDDLKDNYEATGSWDVIDNDANPSPVIPDGNYHGTRCAGVSSAVSNNRCGIGVAYKSKVAGIRLLDTSTTDAKEAAAFSTKSQVNDIYSCSWGPLDNGKTVDGPGPLTKKAILQGITKGRNHSGNIFIVAAGNGGAVDDCNYDGFANSVYTMTIGSVDENLNPTFYSENCAALHAVAFSSSSNAASIVTTDWQEQSKPGCTKSFTGTSAAAPMAAGIVALILEANYCLTWRDVQYIIALSATKINPNDKGWMTNAAGFHHNMLTGFGLLNAWNSVKLAKVWENIPPLQNWKSDNIIAQFGQVSINTEYISNLSVNTGDSMTLTALEHIAVTVSLKHSKRGDLEIYIYCPSGTETKVASARTNDDSKDGYDEWDFSTVRCWGESPNGLWRLRIADIGSIKDGVLKSLRLKLYGSSLKKSDVEQRQK